MSSARLVKYRFMGNRRKEILFITTTLDDLIGAKRIIESKT